MWLKDGIGCIEDFGGDVVHKVSHGVKDLAYDAKKVGHKVRKKLHALTITNAKSSCEDRIKHSLEKGHEDLNSILGDYNDCSSNDKSAIVRNLQKQADGLSKYIEDVTKDDTTQHFCLFSKRISKDDKIADAKNKRESILTIKQHLESNGKQLRPSI